MWRVGGVEIITVERKLGRTGPPFGEHAGPFQDPMMPAVEYAQREAVRLRPASDCRFRVQHPLHPPFAPAALVIIRPKHSAVALSETRLIFHGNINRFLKYPDFSRTSAEALHCVHAPAYPISRSGAHSQCYVDCSAPLPCLALVSVVLTHIRKVFRNKSSLDFCSLAAIGKPIVANLESDHNGPHPDSLSVIAHCSSAESATGTNRPRPKWQECPRATGPQIGFSVCSSPTNASRLDSEKSLFAIRLAIRTRMSPQ